MHLEASGCTLLAMHLTREKKYSQLTFMPDLIYCNMLLYCYSDLLIHMQYSASKTCYLKSDLHAIIIFCKCLLGSNMFEIIKCHLIAMASGCNKVQIEIKYVIA